MGSVATLPIVVAEVPGAVPGPSQSGLAASPSSLILSGKPEVACLQSDSPEAVALALEEHVERPGGARQLLLPGAGLMPNPQTREQTKMVISSH